MKVSVVCVGRARGSIGSAIEEYESRLRHYFSFEVVEVKEATGRSIPSEQAVAEEGVRLLARVPDHHDLVGLHRQGRGWGSPELARYLSDAALQGQSGIAFVIGGAYGLSAEVRRRANHLLSLSAFTFPHELARLLLTEQLYRAGTMIRGEPYHKGEGL